MGADIADINNIGGPEIMTTDMLPPDNYRIKTMTQFESFRMGNMKFDSIYHHQIMQNCLQLNNSNGEFQEIAYMAEVGSSDWSWGALIFDMDLDGWKDIFVSNGIQKDLTDFDFVDLITNNNVVQQVVGESNRADFRDFLPFMPSTKISNVAFMNQKNNVFINKSIEWGLANPSFSNGSAYGDLDNDGDLDLVINNANMTCFIYRNNTVQQTTNNYLKIKLKGPEKNQFGIGAKVIVLIGQQKQELQHYLSRGFESSVAPGLIFGVATVDSIDTLTVIWPDKRMQVLSNIKSNQMITLDYRKADLQWKKPNIKEEPLFTEIDDPVFQLLTKHTENQYNDFQSERLSYKMISAEGPKIVSGDVNGDKLKDLIILGASNSPNKLFLQQKDGSFVRDRQIVFENDHALESTCGAFLDFNNDGDLDLLVGHGGNEYQKGKENFYMRLYENNGDGDFAINIQSTPSIIGNLSCIEPCDFDQDGDIDLFIGARSVPGHYGLVPSSFLLQNNGNGKWIDLTTEEFGKLGMVTAAKWSDMDNDNDPDLIVVGDWMPITVFENTLGLLKKKGVVKDSYGWWSAMEVKDLDNDGDDDYILGNWGLNSKFKASVDRPLKLYVKDFDRNGKTEQILEWFPPGDDKAYPFATKMDIIAQIPHLDNKIKKYADYGRTTYEELFDPEQRQGAIELKSTYLKSAILWNDDNVFRLEALPNEAQVSPIFSIVTDDLDSDGIIDLLLFGNFYGIKPEIGRLDANRGVLLKGMPGGKYSSISSFQSGLKIEGEVRDALIINDFHGDRLLIVARNNLNAVSFLLNEK